MTKLARAAAQQLKGVMIEYDALCSTLIGRTVAEQHEQRRRADALHAQQERARDAQGVGLFTKMVKGMFIGDVRSMLKDLNEDSTGKPWIAKDRLQSTLQGLPTDVLDRVTGEKAEQAMKTEEEVYLEKQLASATAEIERMKQQRATEKEELLKRRNGDSTDAGGVRDKYLDKLSKLKAKAKTRDPTQALSVFTGVSAEKEREREAAAATPAKGLTTWLVHEGANELMSYSTLRGLTKAIMPPQSDLQAEEFQLFCKEMQDQFDYFMPDDEYAKLPDPAPLLAAFNELELRPLEVLVIARHASTIRAAKAAGAYTCHFRKSVNDIPNHSADYQLVGLTDFQFVVEEFNGISYRGRIPQWSPSQF